MPRQASCTSKIYSAAPSSGDCGVDGLTLGHLSASANDLGVELLQVLAENHVDLQLRDRDGRTILHHCALAGSLETADALSFLCNDAGLSTNSHEKDRKTPLDLATVMAGK